MNVRTLPLVAAMVTLAVHLAGNPHYGFYRDELYFIICGFHPAWGYVDQPPVVPLLAAGSQVFGHSLFLLRLVPALFAAGGVYVTCLLVLEFGGGAYAQIVASLAFLFAGVLMSFGTKVSTDEVGLFTWPLIVLFVVRIVKGGDPRWWLAAGAALGVSLESKYSVAFFAVALAGGLLLTPQRRVLASPWFFAGMGLASLIELPNFLWQAVHGFPMLELLHNGVASKWVIVGPGLYLLQQVLITGFFLAPVWILGLVWLVLDRSMRFLAFTYTILIALMIVLHGHHY
ncbi:MAG: glycosyltransferase family 39 protein, partial [Candidatus Eremiobacteraeota bacterium]|nr:glycosyltransferase family 39 protein [Candidatus Eremiobacteraeota bacterium]